MCSGTGILPIYKQEFQLPERKIKSDSTVNPINAYLRIVQGFPEFWQVEVHHNTY